MTETIYSPDRFSIIVIHKDGCHFEVYAVPKHHALFLLRSSNRRIFLGTVGYGYLSSEEQVE